MFLTHFHADFVAGHLELRDRAGAAIHLGASAKRGVHVHADGRRRHGAARSRRLEVLQTPGHSPESISIWSTTPRSAPSAPYAVLTGDTLFIGDVGRPDLRASLGWSADELGGMLYDSLHTKLAPLPDETLVYPAHGAGSLCGKNAEHRHGLDDRRPAQIQLCASADEPRAVHRDRDRRPAGHPGVLHLRCGPQHAGARHARSGARRESCNPLSLAGGAGGRGGRSSAARHP